MKYNRVIHRFSLYIIIHYWFVEWNFCPFIHLSVCSIIFCFKVWAIFFITLKHRNTYQTWLCRIFNNVRPMAANASLGKYIASHERPLWSFIVMLHNSNKPRSHLEHCDRYNYSFGQLMQSWDEKTCHDPKEVTKVQLYSQSGLQLSIFKLFHVHAYKKPCSINLLLLLGV